MQGPRRNDVEEDSEVVGDAAGEHENVPCGMEVGHAVEAEEDDAQGVGQSTGSQPGHSVPADGVKERSRDEDGEPALDQVNGCGGNGEGTAHETVHGDALRDHSGHGQRPDNSKEGPSYWPAQGDEREGRVGCGDEQINGGVIEDPEDTAGARAHQGVVEGGADIDENQRARKDGARDDEPGRSARGGGDKPDGACNGESGADAMRDGVGKDVAQAEVGVHRLMIVRATVLRQSWAVGPGNPFSR